MKLRAAHGILLSLVTGCGDDGANTSGVDASSAGTGTATGSASTSGTASTGSGTGGEGGSGGDPQATTPYVYVGTSADRIFVMLLDRDTGGLSPVGDIDGGPNPSFLASDPEHRYLFAANEGSSEVSSFAIEPSDGTLTFISRVDSQGSGPAHDSGSWLFAAHYGSGHAASIAIASDGTLDDTVVSVELAGQNAHQIRQDPVSGVVYVPCLGSNYVTYFGFSASDGVLDPPPGGSELDLPAGSGPRHLEFHPTLPVAYVINELGDSIVVASRDPSGPLTEIQTVPTLPDDGFDPDDNACADIHITPDGRFLYGSNRGHNTLAIYGVDAQSGMLTALGHEPTGGNWPRNFSIDPAGEILLVANQQSDMIQTFRIDGATGLLTPLVATPTNGGPAFVGVFAQPLR